MDGCRAVNQSRSTDSTNVAGNNLARSSSVVDNSSAHSTNVSDKSTGWTNVVDNKNTSSTNVVDNKSTGFINIADDERPGLTNVIDNKSTSSTNVSTGSTNVVDNKSTSSTNVSTGSTNVVDNKSTSSTNVSTDSTNVVDNKSTSSTDVSIGSTNVVDNESTDSTNVSVEDNNSTVPVDKPMHAVDDMEDVLTEQFDISPVPSVKSITSGLEETMDSSFMDEPLTPATDNSSRSEASKSLPGSGRVTPASQSDQSMCFSSSEKSTPSRKRKSLDMSIRQIEFDNFSSSSGSVKNAKFPQRIGINWRKGERLEAMDYLHKWFPAKIKELNEEEMTVLIHFDGWNQRFDEWVDMSSDRIRPLIRHSERRDRYKRVKTEHKVGEQVYAKWTDCKMYPAKITSVLSNGSYEVIFYDGFKKQVQPINLRAMPTELKQKAFEISTVPEEVLKKTKMKKETGASPDMLLPVEKTSPGITAHKLVMMSPIDTDQQIQTGPDMKPQLTKPKSFEVIKGEVKRELSVERTKVKTKHSNKGKMNVTGQLYKKPTVKSDGSDVGSASVTVVKSEPVSTQTDYMQHKMSEKDTCEIKVDNTTSPYTSAPGLQPAAVTQILPQTNVSVCGPALLPPKAFVVESDHNRYKCQFEGCNKGFRKEHLLEYHIKYYHIDGGAPPPVQLPRKRRKTTSTCSNESESAPSSKKAAVKKSRNISAESMFIKEIEPEIKEGEDCFTQQLPLPQETGEISTQTTPIKHSEQTAVDETNYEIVKQELKTETKRCLSQDSNMLEESSWTDADEYLKPDELVNCICDFYEENGLMIQCEVCMCWQHASCFGITERTLPKTYVCFVCENPPGVRESSRYIHEQEWLKTGEVASFNYLNLLPPSEERCTSIKATQSLIVDIHQLNTVLHSLKMQLKILRTKDEKKLKLWRMDWDVVETFHDVMEAEREPNCADSYDGDTIMGSNSNENDTKGDNDIALVSDIQEGYTDKTDAKSDETNEQIENMPTSEEKENESEQDDVLKWNDKTSTTESYVGGGVEGCDKSPKEKDGVVQKVVEELTVNSESECQKEIQEQEREEKLHQEIDQEEANHSDSTESVVEDPIEICEKNLLSHILRVQAEISDKLDTIEEQVSLLETLESAHMKRETPSIQTVLADVPQLKRTMKIMHNDLFKVKKMSVFH